ncbi:MAG: pseudouridine synthase [Archaeoglobales archaeon]|nr:MAG: pseudouridine synthase [Archaeoglobales archaeon]
MRRLRKKEAKAIAAELKKLGIVVSGDMDRVKINGKTVILVNGEPLLLEYEGKIYLTVYGALKFKPERWKVTVDEGALPYIMNGADVMKPGIVHADEGIKTGDFVYVTVEGKESPIAVGIALVDGKEMKEGKGKAVKNIHHLKDKVWNHFFGKKG